MIKINKIYNKSKIDFNKINKKNKIQNINKFYKINKKIFKNYHQSYKIVIINKK